MSISIVDIKRAIMRKLKSKYPNHTIYAEQIPQDFKKPSFFIYFVPLETEHNSQYFIEKSVMIKIDYYCINKTNEENWIMADELEYLFHTNLIVKDRYLTINRTNSEEVDGVMVFTLTVNYENGIEMIAMENDDGEIVYADEDEQLGYIDGKVELIQDLRIE